MLEPLLRRDRAEPDALAAGVVLLHDRAEPLDHRASRRAGTARPRARRPRGSRGRTSRSRRVVELQQPHEVRRHELHVGDAVALDQLETGDRIEVAHRDDGAAEALHGRRPTRRRRVVQRRGAQVHRALGASVEPPDQAAERGRRAERRADGRRLHALGASGRARRIEHPVALALTVDGRDGLRGERLLVSRRSRGVAALHDAQAEGRGAGLGGGSVASPGPNTPTPPPSPAMGRTLSAAGGASCPPGVGDPGAPPPQVSANTSRPIPMTPPGGGRRVPRPAAPRGAWGAGGTRGGVGVGQPCAVGARRGGGGGPRAGGGGLHGQRTR